MRLFRYISGDNAAERKIEMTVPVFSGGSREAGTMSFLVPEEVAKEGPPEATNAEVTLDRMNGGRFAVYRFSGGWSAERRDVAKRKLNDWISTESLRATDEVLVASYDPPFTPAFLRRNEILVRLEPESE